MFFSLKCLRQSIFLYLCIIIKPKTNNMNHNSPDGIDNTRYRMPKHLIDKEELHPNEEELRNEQKTPLFIFLKHMIRDMQQHSISRIERYVDNYCGIANPKDVQEIREIFNEQVKQLMK